MHDAVGLTNHGNAPNLWLGPRAVAVDAGVGAGMAMARGGLAQATEVGPVKGDRGVRSRKHSNALERTLPNVSSHGVV
jgi:hypothetical protein